MGTTPSKPPSGGTTTTMRRASSSSSSAMGMKQNGAPSSSTMTTTTIAAGYRVLGVLRGSPVAKLHLVPWFDFIVGINEDRQVPPASEDDTWFDAHVRENVPLRLTVYNAKARHVRDVFVTPRRDWGGPGLLGLKIEKLPQPIPPDESACRHVVRVMGIRDKKSLAHEIGLAGEYDYILGSECYLSNRGRSSNFEGLDEFSDFVLAYFSSSSSQGSTEPELPVHVYNAMRDTVRIVSFRPRPNGTFQLGAELSCGLLHEIPAKNRRTAGRDESAVLDGPLAADVRVYTPEGEGRLMASMPDGSSVIKLDWNLDNQCDVFVRMSAQRAVVASPSAL